MVALGKGAGAEMVRLLIDFGATTSTSQGQGLADWVTGTGVSVSDEVKALLEGQIFYRTRITFKLYHNNTPCSHLCPQAYESLAQTTFNS